MPYVQTTPHGGVAFSGPAHFRFLDSFSMFALRCFGVLELRWRDLLLHDQVQWDPTWDTETTKLECDSERLGRDLGVSENSVPLNPMVNDHYPH